MDRETVALEIFGMHVERKMDTFGDQKDFCYEVADWAIAQAEAAEKQNRILEELVGSLVGADEDDLDQQLATAEQRIAELERLVPDADMLEHIANHVVMTDSFDSLMGCVTAIRKYREAHDESQPPQVDLHAP